jgi:anti-anti-sigma regulatory factor
VNGEHWCLVSDRDAAAAKAASFLPQRAGRRPLVGYFGWGGADELEERLHGLGPLAITAPAGVHRIRSLSDDFRPDVVPDPETYAAYWAAATQSARDEGFTGLRALAEVTPWAQQADQWSRFVQSELLLDRYTLDHPLDVMCRYETALLDDRTLDEAAALHRLVRGRDRSFCLHAAPAGLLQLAGEIDDDRVPVLARLLDLLEAGSAGVELVIDVGDLEFIQHDGMLALDRFGERVGATVVLRRARRVVADLAVLLDLRRVRVETEP